MLRCSHVAFLLALAVAPASAQDAPTDPARELADRVAKAAGIDAWGQAGVVRFAFVFAPKGIERRYVWDVRAGTVEVTDGELVTTVPVAGWDNAAVEGRAITAHRHFVNDSFWAFPCLHLAWDEGVELEDLGEVEVPTLPDLGPRRALSLRYAEDAGGYTPGDRYVFYLGDDDYPVAWAFHPQGAEAPRFVAEWREPRQVGGLRVVSQYWALGGALNLAIDDVQVEQAEGAAPTSRPAAGD
jgi:hypothetical protein